MCIYHRLKHANEPREWKQAHASAEQYFNFLRMLIPTAKLAITLQNMYNYLLVSEKKYALGIFFPGDYITHE